MSGTRSKRALQLLSMAAALARPVAAQSGDAAALNLTRTTGAESCPDLRELSRRIDAQLGRAAFVSPTQANVLFDVTLSPSETGGWRAAILASGSSGEQLGRRELTLPQASCSEAADATALALALMIDPTLGSDGAATTLEPLPSPPAPPVEAPPAPPVEPLRAPAPAPPSPPLSEPAPRPLAARDPWRTRIAAGVLGTVGQVPHIAWGLFMGARFAPPRSSWAGELGVSFVATRRAELPGGGGGDVDALLAEARVQWLAVDGARVSLALGPKLQLGRLQAVGSGFDLQNRRASSAVVNAGLELEAGLSLSPRLRVLARPGLVVSLFRERFEGTTSDGQTRTIFRAASVIPALALGLGFEP